MKKFLNPSSTFAFAIAGLLTILGCGKSESGTAAGNSQGKQLPAPTSVSKTSFQEVTSKLDSGGEFYLYLNTAQFLDRVSTKLSDLQKLVTSMPMEGDATDREKIDKTFDLLKRVVKDSGVEDVSGLGVSSIKRESGLYHSKAFLHHYQGKGGGFLWSLFGKKAHNLDSLDLLPANTVLASYSDVDAPMLWSVLQKQVQQSGIPEAEEGLRELPAAFEQATHLKWDQVLASLGNEYGIALTLNQEKLVPIPIPGQLLKIPEPALMLMIKVKDDVVFNRIDEALTQMGQRVLRTNTSELKLRTVLVPVQTPIELRPTIARSGDYLFIATTDTIIREAVEVKAGRKPGIKSTPEFARLSKDVPEQGNHFTFMSAGLGQAIMALGQQASASLPAEQGQWLQSLLNTNTTAALYSVAANTDEGWMAVANGNQHPFNLLLAGTAAPVGMLAAIAVPNFVRARSTAQNNACINNLRQLDGAKQQWALEFKKDNGAVPTRSDVAPYLRGGALSACPQGGTYTLRSVGELPTCSIPGHRIPE
jgi:hypothetical protein